MLEFAMQLRGNGKARSVPRGIEGDQSLVNVVEKIPGAASELIQRRTEPAGLGKSAGPGENPGAEVRIACQIRMGIAIRGEAKEVKRLHRCARPADAAIVAGARFHPDARGCPSQILPAQCFSLKTSSRARWQGSRGRHSRGLSVH